MSEIPHLPSKEEILARATQLFIQERSRLGLPAITPEESELKEGNYWEKARNELMSGLRSQLEGYLAYLQDEASKVKAELGITEVTQEEKVTELENKLSNITERYNVTKARLKEARVEIERIKAPPPPRAPPTPRVPPTPLRGYGLSAGMERHLKDLFDATLAERGVTPAASSRRGYMAIFRTRLEEWKTALKDKPSVEAFANVRERVLDLVRSVLEMETRRVAPTLPVGWPLPLPVQSPPATPEEKGLTVDDEQVLRDYFEQQMRNATVNIEQVRGRFIYEWDTSRTIYAELPRREAFERAGNRLIALIKDIYETMKAPLVEEVAAERVARARVAFAPPTPPVPGPVTPDEALRQIEEIWGPDARKMIEPDVRRRYGWYYREMEKKREE